MSTDNLNSTCNKLLLPCKPLNTLSVDTPPSSSYSFSTPSSTAYAITNNNNTNPVNLISDSGATGIYLPTSHASLLTSVNANHHPITVQLPNNQHLTSTSSGSITLGSLPTSALTTHIFPQLAQPLLGTAQLCDNDLTVIYTKTALTILGPYGNVLFNTPRVGALWTVPVDYSTHPCPPRAPSLPTASTAYNLYPISTDNAAICLFWQRSFYSPCKQTMLSAASAGLFQAAGLSILTPSFIRKHYVHTVATAKGHLNRSRKNEQSTQPVPISPPPGITIPAPTASSSPIRLALYQPTGQHYTDATTTFPSSPSRYHLLIMYHYDANYIHIEIIESFTQS